MALTKQQATWAHGERKRGRRHQPRGACLRVISVWPLGGRRGLEEDIIRTCPRVSTVQSSSRYHRKHQVSAVTVPGRVKVIASTRSGTRCAPLAQIDKCLAYGTRVLMMEDFRWVQRTIVKESNHLFTLY